MIGYRINPTASITSSARIRAKPDQTRPTVHRLLGNGPRRPLDVHATGHHHAALADLHEFIRAQEVDIDRGGGVRRYGEARMIPRSNSAKAQKR